MKFFKPTQKLNLDNSAVKANIGQKAARAFAFVAAGNMMSNLVTISGTVVLARLLTPNDFGLMAMIGTATGLLMVFESFGLYMVTIQKSNLTHDEMNFLFWLNLLVASMMGLLLFLAAPFIAHFFKKPELIPLTQVIALTFVLRGAANQHSALLNRNLLHGKSSVAGVLGAISGTIVAIIAALLGAGVWALALRQVAEAIIRTVSMWIFSGWIPAWVKWKKEYMPSVHSGTRITLTNLMYYTSRNADDILVGRYIGADPLGQYKLSYQVLLLPLRRISDPIASVMVPLMAQILDEPERYRKNYMAVAKILHLLNASLGIFVMFHATVIVTGVFGEKWKDAIEPMRWLAISMLAQGITNTTGWLFLTQQRNKEMMQWSMFSSAVTVISFLIGLPFGINGVAAAWSIGCLILAPILYYVTGRTGPITTKDLYKLTFADSPVFVTFILVQIAAHYFMVGLPLYQQLITIVISGSLLPLIILAFPDGRKTAMDAYNFAKKGSKKAV